jgi:hypothetical protein
MVRPSLELSALPLTVRGDSRRLDFIAVSAYMRI